MSQRTFPIYKTGWFYLLLLLWGVAYWSLMDGVFNRFNQLNLYALFQSSNLQSPELPVLRLRSSLNEDDFPKIEKLLLRYPQTSILFVDEPSVGFSNRLQLLLRKHPRPSKIIVATSDKVTKLTLKSESRSIFNPVISWFRELAVRDVEQQGNSNVVFAPFIQNKRNQISLFYQSNKTSYLTVMGEVIRQVENDQSLKLIEGWQLELSNKNNSWPLGFNGDVSAAADIPQAVELTKINHSRAKAAKLFIFDTNNSLYGDQISRVAVGLLNKNYLYQSIPLKFIQYILLIAGLYLLWFIRESVMKTQLIILTAYVVLICILQYFLASENLWLEIVPSILVLYFSWGISLAFQHENQIFIGYNQRYNQLLANSLNNFDKKNGITELQKLLTQTLPDNYLVDKVFKLALRREKEGDVESAKKLYLWIDSSGIDHQGNKQKMVAYRQHSNNPAINRLKAAKHSPTAKLTSSTKTVRPKDVAQKATSAHYQSPVTSAKPQSKAKVVISNKPKPVEVVEEESVDELEQTLIITPGQKPPNLAATGTFKMTQFGRYQVEGILGKGAMGIVYQGVDPKINRHVAIKTLQLSEGAEDHEIDEAKERFFREAETAGNLSHANIVTIYDVGEEGPLGYIAMDLLTGAPLSHFIKAGNLLPTALVYQLMIQITDSLEYAHKQNVVHRDIKPGNIIYDDDLQRVTVTDFGIAYVADNSKTRTGVIMGSPYYMSPEQVLGKQVDGRSDIFSLGATFYQLLSGCLPFEGDSVVSVVYKITNEKHKAVSQCNDKLPASATRITNKALHKDIDKRYQTMQEFKLALINALKRDFKKAPII
ncbi:MAG: serine/threonine protein kinase [Colwellia sp.]|nr:serine/threonine protein kinase [Colwellia sp.]